MAVEEILARAYIEGRPGFRVQWAESHELAAGTDGLTGPILLPQVIEQRKALSELLDLFAHGAIHPRKDSPGDLTYHPARARLCAWRGPGFHGWKGLDELRSRRRDQVGTGRRAKGRLIRHAGFQAAAVLTLAVAMIVTAPGGLLMAAIGSAALLAASFLPAAGAAITLAAITVAVDIKHPAAGRKATNELVKDGGTGPRHWFRKGTLDNRRRSCQDGSWLLELRRSGPPVKNPGWWNNRGSPLCASGRRILSNPEVSPNTPAGDDAHSQEAASVQNLAEPLSEEKIPTGREQYSAAVLGVIQKDRWPVK